MTVCSATLVPELQHWFHEFVTGSIVNKYKMPIPVDIAESYLVSRNRGSFVELLFNDNYPYDYVYTLYTPNPSWSCIPIHVLNRLQIYPGVGQYMKLAEDQGPDSTGQNIFNLGASENVMIGILFEYRKLGRKPNTWSTSLNNAEKGIMGALHSTHLHCQTITSP